MEVSETITRYLQKITRKEDIIPVIITTNFSKVPAGSFIPIDPRVFLANSSLYDITKMVLDESVRKYDPDEICLVYLGLIFNPTKEDPLKKDPSLIFQVQTKEKVTVFGYHFVDCEDGYITVSPNPTTVNVVEDIAESTLPFIIKNFNK